YWQMNSKLFLIDNNGVIIEGDRHQTLSHLPVITGEKAAEKFPLLMKELADFPDIYNRMTGAVFISKRRWDIILDAKLKVKLPEQGIQQAMRYLTNLEGDHALASKDISSVDLRIPDRAFFTLSENARMMKFYNSKDKQA
ncbi:MAG: cell division protein FtsQ, partial [Alphaproteobacteria bacterium]|nr:cell division protein FtsQ [Alphaproteobacteria bacterium]MBX9976653.1 cell division protein FtsQ [Alphaproteobacteria bacterium]